MTDGYSRILDGDLRVPWDVPDAPERWACIAATRLFVDVPDEAAARDAYRRARTATTGVDRVRTGCAHAALGAFVRLDGEAVHAWARALEADETDWQLAAARGWSAIVRGLYAEALDAALAQIPEAQRAGTAPAVVELTAQAALASLELGDIESATTLARRASRMARAEELLPFEYLANVILARVRRHAGRPHLGRRILAALARVVPPAWHAWVSWERTLAGDGAGLGQLRAGAPRFMEDELRDVSRCVDPDAPIEGRCARWLRGEVDAIPGAVAGLAGSTVDAAAEEHAGVFVLARPSRTARRVLRSGAIEAVGEAAVLEAAFRRAQERIQTTLATLALAGDAGLPEAELFERVYGFRYQRDRHMGTFRTLVHRAGRALSGRGRIARDGPVLRLVVEAPLVVADPRCALDLADLILRSLASLGEGAGARELAEGLHVPLRTVQLALGNMVDEGVCLAVRSGRNIVYRVEDTTFNEPTISRLTPKEA